MQPQEWQRIKDVLSAALDRPAAEREQFLAEACGTDRDLRKEVDSLLAAHEDPDNLLEQHSLDLHARLEAGAADYVGKRFGPYRIVREIGRGGMGAVFLAERADGAFQQQVALKIIRHGVAEGELERHFRRERQILASLNHPNIAKLLDGGVSDTGELFLAMEFIAGEPLVDYAEHRDLTIEARLLEIAAPPSAESAAEASEELAEIEAEVDAATLIAPGSELETQIDKASAAEPMPE